MLLGRRKKGAGAATAAATISLYYASDVHGSERCWRKFLGAGRFYGVQALLMGGDLTGKAIVPIETRPDGSFTTTFIGETRSGTTEDRARRVARSDSLQRHVPVAGSGRRDRAAAGRRPGQVCSARGNDGRGAPALDRPGRRAYGRVRHRRLRDAGQRRPLGLRRGARVGYTRPSLRRPRRPRRPLRDDLVRLRKPDALEQPAGARRGRAVRAVPRARRPARGPGDGDLQPSRASVRLGARHCERDEPRPTLRYVGGQPRPIPVGSHAVRQIIEEVQPLLALHGHIHESRGEVQIGRTLALNTGSEYNSGHIHGAVVTLDGATVRKHQFVVG